MGGVNIAKIAQRVMSQLQSANIVCAATHRLANISPASTAARAAQLRALAGNLRQSSITAYASGVKQLKGEVFLSSAAMGGAKLGVAKTAAATAVGSAVSLSADVIAKSPHAQELMQVYITRAFNKTLDQIDKTIEKIDNIEKEGGILAGDTESPPVEMRKVLIDTKKGLETAKTHFAGDGLKKTLEDTSKIVTGNVVGGNRAFQGFSRAMAKGNIAEESKAPVKDQVKLACDSKENVESELIGNLASGFASKFLGEAVDKIGFAVALKLGEPGTMTSIGQAIASTAAGGASTIFNDAPKNSWEVLVGFVVGEVGGKVASTDTFVQAREALVSALADALEADGDVDPAAVLVESDEKMSGKSIGEGTLGVRHVSSPVGADAIEQMLALHAENPFDSIVEDILDGLGLSDTGVPEKSDGSFMRSLFPGGGPSLRDAIFPGADDT